MPGSRTQRRANDRARRKMKPGPIRSPLTQVPRDEWPVLPDGWVQPINLWRSEAVLVQMHRRHGQALRLSICMVDGSDGISWDDLQWIKEQTHPGCWAVEAFPPEEEVQNVANMRHLWLIPAGAFTAAINLNGCS